MTTFFCTVYTLRFFPLVSADNSEVGKLSLSKPVFYAEFCSSVWNVDIALSDPCCSTSNIYAHHCDCTQTSCPFFVEMCWEKIVAEYMDAAPFISMWSASSVELSPDTCGGKLQHVVLASVWQQALCFHFTHHQTSLKKFHFKKNRPVTIEYMERVLGDKSS